MDRGNQSSFLCIYFEWEKSSDLVFLIEELSGKCALLLQNIRCLQKKSEGCRKFRGEIGQSIVSRSAEFFQAHKKQEEFFQLYSSPFELLCYANSQRDHQVLCQMWWQSWEKKNESTLSNSPPGLSYLISVGDILWRWRSNSKFEPHLHFIILLSGYSLLSS